MRLQTLPTRAAWMLAAIGLSCLTASAQTDKSSSPTLHATAKLVIVDVTVTDGRGDPVRGLKQSDFRVIEGKTPQTIRNFEEHIGVAVNSPTAEQAKLEPGVFTNATTTPGNPEVNVLLLDMLNTPMQDQSFVRGQLLKYLASAKPGTRIAIFGLTTRLLMLQPFTTDTEALRRAIDRSHPNASTTMTEKVGGKEDIAASLAADLSAQLAVSPQMAYALAEFDATEKNLDQSLSAQYTLRALNQLARYLAGVPGRKNLIWFSEAFPIDFQPRMSLPGGGTALNPFAGAASWDSEYRETLNLLARSRIAVYPIDARGLVPSPALQASFSRGQGGFSKEIFESHSTMFDLADQTGGKAFVNTNGLAQAVETVVDAASNYYTLSYAPTDANAHGEYRGIRVQLDGGNYKLAYRRGYYADSNAPTPSKPDLVKSAPSFVTPPPTQIPFYARVSPLSPDAAPVVAPGDTPRPRTELEKGHFVRYRVDLSVDPRNIAIATGSDGQRHSHLEFIVLGFDAEGRKVNSDVKSVQATWNTAQFARAQQQGVRYQQEIGVPANGAFTLRVMIHDLQTDAIGGIDIPLAKLPANLK